MKKFLCLFLVVLLTLSLVACSSGKQQSSNSSGNNSSSNSSISGDFPNENLGNNNIGAVTTPTEPIEEVDNSIKKGTPCPVGDIFKLPDVKQETNAPIIAEISKQAYPGDSIMVSGEGFEKSGVKFFVYSQSEENNGKAIETKFTVVDDTYASVLIDEKLEYGVYGIYATNASGSSAIKTVNKAKIWSIGLYKLSAGEKLTILGENLTTDNDNKTTVFLVSEDNKEYAQVSVLFADPGKVEILIPDTLTVGKKYNVMLHNGHGGSEGFTVGDRPIEYLEKPIVQFTGKVLNVVDYGADPKALGNDDSVALQKLVNDAQDGDTIYFPPGSYLLVNSVTINKSVRILGAGADKTKIFAGYNISGGALNIKKGPCEITGICFEQKRTTGKLKGYFVHFTYNNNENGIYNLYFHANAVIQSVTAKSRSANWPVYVTGSYGIIVEDNYFNATGMLYASGSRKIYLRNNTAIMNIYCGTYYQFENALFTNIEFLDVSNNSVTGGGAPADGPGELLPDTFTAGRVFGVQGWGHNTYISHNTIRRAGVPNFNSGEIILYENIGYRYDGDVKESTATITDLLPSDKNEISANNVVTIVSGKGKGQYRKIKRVTNLCIQVDTPWDIIPDETSHVIISHGYLNAFVCFNDLNGYTNWQEAPGSAMGIQAYGAIHNMYYNFNVLRNASYGIEITPFYYNNITAGQEANARCVISWSHFDRNYLQNVSRGIGFVISTSGNNKNAPIVGEIAFGNVVRKNTIKDILDFTADDKKGSGGTGIKMGVTNSKWVGNWCVANLIEANDLSNCASSDIGFYDNQANNVFRNNTNGNKKASMKISRSKLGPIETKY